jgi:glycosyltransferase involved in cell wall biosynthesis
MKILFLTTHLDIGGITSYLLTLSKGCHRQGHLCYMATGGGNMARVIESHGVTLWTLNIRTKSELSPKLYAALFRLSREIRQNQIEVIHAQTRVTQVMAAWLSLLTGVPFVSTCHGFFKTRWSRRMFPCWGRRVIAISPAVQQHLIEDFGIAQENVCLIPNGIDVEDFSRAVRDGAKQRERSLKGGGPVIGIIARLSDVKGHAVLIRAMPEILRYDPRVCLWIVGEGREEGNLKQLVQSCRVSASVKFYPVVNRTQDFLPEFDVFVMPSLQEGLGLSVMEAQACGLAVVASRVGGLPSLIEDGRTGYLVPPDDPSALAAAIIRMLKDPQDARRMGERAREFIRTHFSADKMVNDTLGVYRKAFERL